MDWHVAPVAATGDGSRERPFHDPWVALRHAEPGDRVLLAAGTYFGRDGRSSWVADTPDVTVLGGFDVNFRGRTPWSTPTIFAARSDSRTGHEPNMLRGDGIVLDGLYFDAASRASYGEGPILGLRGERIAVRNCVFANGSAGAAEIAGDGARFENNLVVNFSGIGLLTVRAEAVVVSGNTFCFAHDDADPPRGSGADKAVGVRVLGAADIAGNTFVGCGNAGVACFGDLGRTAIDGNVFFLSPRDAVRSRATSADARITPDFLEEIEDLGLRSASGNTTGDPHLTGLPADWVDAYTRDLRATYAQPPIADLDAFRAAAGLAPLGAAEAATVRPLTPPEVLSVAARHARELPSGEPGEARTIPAEYRRIAWAEFARGEAGSTAVELRAGLGFEQNVELLADAGSATHLGIAIYEPGADDRALYVLVRRHGLAHHQIEDAIRYQRGLDVESTYLVRGTYRRDMAEYARQAATVVVDAVVPDLALDAPATVRPIGRNWFVRAGSAGGDGSREAPFRDPFQALEKAQGGDTVHVAGGEYSGRLRSGAWRIPVRNLTLLGGYDENFTSRDPWARPVRFVLNPEIRARGIPPDPILTPEDTCAGLILDGFVFDGSTYNAYTESGSLDVARSPSSALVELRGDGIEVRNCAFVNAAASAVRIGGAYGVLENNVVVNSSGTAVFLQTPGPGPWEVRGNVILYAADPTGRAPMGNSTTGALLDVSGRAIVRIRSNVLAFADGIAVRAMIPDQNALIEGNVIAANLDADVFDGRNVLVTPSDWDRAVLDDPFGSLSGNLLRPPELPVDRAYAQTALDRIAGLPAHLPADLLQEAAGVLGLTYRVAAPVEEVEEVKPATDGLAGLLADLGRSQKEAEPPKEPDVAYCPAYPVSGLAALFAWKGPIDVAFPEEAPPKPPVEYRPVDAAAIDADPAALDGVPIVLEVTEVRSSAANASLYPAGTGRDDHEAFSVVSAGGYTRTRLAVIVRDDTAEAKAFGRLRPSDTVRIEGVGHVVQNGSALSVTVDSLSLSQATD